jgi:hypothetical protein
MALQPFVWPWPLLQFRDLFYTDGRHPWTSDQPVARPLPTHRTTQTQNKCTDVFASRGIRSQRSSERRQFMPQTARPPWWAHIVNTKYILPGKCDSVLRIVFASGSLCYKRVLIRTAIFPVFYVGVKLVLWHYRRNIDWGCLRTIGPKREKVTGDWRKLHNEELQYLYSSPNIIRMIKSRRLRWEEHYF